MTSEPLAFFTLDRGSATTAAALVCPVGERFRLLASGSVPAAVDAETLLEDLVWRVMRTTPDILGEADGWRSWARLEVRTGPLPGVVVVAPSDETAAAVAAGLAARGWAVAGRVVADHLDAAALGELALDPSVGTVLLALEAEAAADRRGPLLVAWDLALALARMRDDLHVLAAGPLGERPDDDLAARVHALPPLAAADEPGPELLAAAGDMAAWLSRPGGERRGAMDGRAGLRASVTSLAALLHHRVSAIEVGASAGSRTLAGPQGLVGQLVCASGALVPPDLIRDDDAAAAILRWSTLRGDPGALVDRLRNLRLAPWRDIGGEGARLRFAALRAALARLSEAHWPDPVARAEAAGPPDIVVATGGAFLALPPAAAALAIVDAIRAPGAYAMLLDHARVLAPIGSLSDEGDRRRLLADLLDDALLPLGTALMTGELRQVGRSAGLLQVASSIAQEQIPLLPGELRLVDLPPGVTARLDLESREGGLLGQGVAARRVTLEVSGGLAGLLVDTRETPLRLPESADQRRGLLAAWEAAAWPGMDA